jgi:hypothetical protein
MAVNDDSEAFYDAVPILRGFGTLMDPARYVPIPDDWSIGVADVVESTKDIAENRYKAVNMACAAVIASVTNALGCREFPSAFGGDGASFAISPRDREHAHSALAATAAWAAGELGLNLRVALMPLAVIRAQGMDVRVARYAPSENVSFAMFSGGGVAWAEAALTPRCRSRSLSRPDRKYRDAGRAKPRWRPACARRRSGNALAPAGCRT